VYLLAVVKFSESLQDWVVWHSRCPFRTRSPSENEFDHCNIRIEVYSILVYSEFLPESGPNAIIKMVKRPEWSMFKIVNWSGQHVKDVSEVRMLEVMMTIISHFHVWTDLPLHSPRIHFSVYLMIMETRSLCFSRLTRQSSDGS